jgi:hypothetical protein
LENTQSWRHASFNDGLTVRSERPWLDPETRAPKEKAMQNTDANTTRPYIVLDIETELTWDAAKARCAHPALQRALFASHAWIAVTSDLDGQTLTWQRDEAEDLLEYLGAHRVTGWNIDDFDLPIIALTVFQQRRRIWSTGIESLDLFAQILRDTKVMFKLEAVAQENLGEGKLSSSAEIPALFAPLARERRRKWETIPEYARIVEHCQRDVLLERMLFQQALTTGLRLPEVPASKYLPEGRAASLWRLPEPTPDETKAEGSSARG